MKKESLTSGLISVFFVFSAVLLVRCTSADDKTPVAVKKAELTDTAYLVQSNVDTSEFTREVEAMEEKETAPQKVAVPSAKPVAIKTPITKTPNPTKQPSGTEKPPVILPPTETPEVVPPETKATPKVEPEPEPEPVPTPKPKSPVVKQVGFSLKSTKAVIKGSSSLHDWESKVTQMEGKGSFETKDDELIALKDVEIKIAVTGIKSKEGKKMDNKTYETFKSDQNPYIIYKFSNAVVKINDSNVVTIEATGKLTMAGNTQSVSLSATGKKLPNGDLQLSVSKKLKMTDYKMEPPVMMLGAIKVGDEITVEFDFVLERIK